MTSLSTFLFGWWALPFGPLRTIRALLWNARGGKDVTESIIRQYYDEPTLARLLAIRPQEAPPIGSGLIALRILLLLPPLAFGLAIWKIEAENAAEKEQFSSIPGGSAFLETRRKIFLMAEETTSHPNSSANIF